MNQNQMQSKPADAEQESGKGLDGTICYASLQIKLLSLIGDAERATKGAKTPEDMQACGQMARRLCYALTGF